MDHEVEEGEHLEETSGMITLLLPRIVGMHSSLILDRGLLNIGLILLLSSTLIPVTPWVQHLMNECGCTFQQLVDSDYRRFAKW